MDNKMKNEMRVMLIDNVHEQITVLIERGEDCAVKDDIQGRSELVKLTESLIQITNNSFLYKSTKAMELYETAVCTYLNLLSSAADVCMAVELPSILSASTALSNCFTALTMENG
ncbi:MAG: hypothetical protein Q4G33_11370 [bacterium]|nr:hypothetical protein [bacterium]